MVLNRRVVSEYNPDMKFSIDQVKHVAKLANLPLTDREEEQYTDQLSKILDYIDQLNQVKTDNIEPTFNVTEKKNIFADDQVKESLPQDQALQNTDQKKAGLFITKGVFNE